MAKTNKEKIEHLKSKSLMINELLEKRGCEYFLGFRWSSAGASDRCCYKVRRSDDVIEKNIGTFASFETMRDFLDGFYNALNF